MICVIGYLDKKSKKVYIGGDSASSNTEFITQSKDKKIFKNGDFIFGCITSWRMIQLLKYSFVPPQINSDDIHHYMCTDFIESIKKCFKDGGFIKNEDDKENYGGDFIVGYKDRLFFIDILFAVHESFNNFHALGSGAYYALGSMFSDRKNKLNPKEKIIKALDASAFFSPSVCKPYYIINT